MSLSDRKMNKKISPFILKLVSILQEPENHQWINWTSPGTFFIVDSDELSKNILTKYFKHSNFSSFIRQLNLYGFEKVKTEQNCHHYHHTNFIPSQKRKLKLIQRKTKKNQGEASGKDSQEVHIENKKSNGDLEVIVTQLRKQNVKVRNQNTLLHQQIRIIKQENKKQIGKIIGFLSKLVDGACQQKKDVGLQGSCSGSGKVSQVFHKVSNQIQNLQQCYNLDKVVDFQTVFVLLGDAISCKNQGNQSNLRLNQMMIQEKINIKPILNLIDREYENNDHNNAIYQQEVQERNSYLNIDNFFSKCND